MSNLIPTGWRKTLYQASRSKRTLWIVAISIVLVGILTGVVASLLYKPGAGRLADRIAVQLGAAIDHDDEDLEKAALADDASEAPRIDGVTIIERELTNGHTGFIDLFQGVPQLAPHLPAPALERLDPILRKHFTPEEAAFVLDYIAAWNAGRSAFERLQARADARKRYANYALGRIEAKRRNYLVAARYFEREGREPEAFESRFRAVATYVKARDFEQLQALAQDPLYREFFNPYVSLKIASAKRDWAAILRLSPLVQLESYTTIGVAMALIVGLSWAFFIGHLAEWPRFWSWSTMLAVAAIICGILSTTVTLYLITLEEDVLKITLGEDPVHIVLYFVAGVGLREEVSKLLLFLPLIPILLRRDHELEVLAIASLVGLGFAIEENTGYFARSAATSAGGRFLTASFMHMALTGVSGLSLYRAFRLGTRGLNEFLWVFPVCIIAHGAYDAFMAIPGISDGGYVSMIVFVAFCYLYFDRANQLRDNVRMTISLTGAFVLGTAVVLAALFGYVMATLGVAAGIAFALSELIGCGVLILMFLRIFNEPLSE